MSSFPSSSFGSQSQIAAIMDVLAKAAVAEISKLVDDGTVVLRLEMCRKDSEIEELKRSLQLMCRKDGEIEELKRSLQLMERELCKAREAEAAATRIADDHQKQQRCVLLGSQVSLEDACREDLETDATYSESKGVNSLFETGHQPEESGGLGLKVKFEPVDKMDDQETIENAEMTNNDAFVTEDHCGPQWPSLHDLCEGDSIEPQLFEAHTDQYSTHSNNQNSCSSILAVAAKVNNTVDNLRALIKEETEVQPVSLGDNMPAMVDSIQTEPYMSRHVSQHQPVNGEARRLQSGPQQAGPSHGTEDHHFNRSALKAKRPVHVWRAGTSLLPRLFTCSVCGRGFPRLCQLEAHQFTHGTVKPFRCLECGKSFTQNSHLKTHQRSVHTGERPFSCTICGKMFSRQDNCLRHERFHSGLRPYSCGQCGKSFTVLGNLKIHQEIHQRGR